MTKTEKINEIIRLSREASVIKNKKKQERRLQTARINLLKCSDEEVDEMYNGIIEKGAKEYFDEKAEKYK